VRSQLKLLVVQAKHQVLVFILKLLHPFLQFLLRFQSSLTFLVILLNEVLSFLGLQGKLLSQSSVTCFLLFYLFTESYIHYVDFVVHCSGFSELASQVLDFISDFKELAPQLLGLSLHLPLLFVCVAFVLLCQSIQALL